MVFKENSKGALSIELIIVFTILLLTAFTIFFIIGSNSNSVTEVLSNGGLL